MKQERILTFTIFLFATLACTIFVGGPDIPAQPIPVSTEAVVSLQEQIEQAKAAAGETGVMTLQISEPQLTSYLAFKLQQQDSEALLRDPQVYLRDGQMQVYGKAYQGNLVANVAVIFTVGVDDEGKPKMELTSADFGPFPVPDGLKEAIATVVQEAYTGPIGPVATGLRLENVTIADGFMTLTGKTK